MADQNLPVGVGLPMLPADANGVQSFLDYLNSLRAAGIDIESRYSITDAFAHIPLPSGQGQILLLNRPCDRTTD